MKIRRRMTFQLTPLLDLLLIVIFAQSMEVRQQSSRLKTELEKERAKVVQQIDNRELQFAAQQQDAEQRLKAREAELDQTREQYARQFQSIVKQQQQAGETLAKALNLPGTVMQQVLKLRSSNRQDEADSLEDAMQQLSQMLNSREEELLQFLLRFDEMQKHVSIWELYLQENGKAALSDGEQSDIISFSNGDEFVQQALEASKAFSEPKPLVIIMLSFGDAQAGQRRRLIESMPQFLNQLRTDSGNARWFDYSLMGFRANGPVLNSQQSTNPE